jgi:hypothetical protein
MQSARGPNGTDLNTDIYIYIYIYMYVYVCVYIHAVLEHDFNVICLGYIRLAESQV